MKPALAVLALAGLVACGEPSLEAEREEALQEDLGALHTAVEQYAADHGGELPESLDVLVRPDADGRHYLPSGTPALFDPWGRRYVYEPSPDGSFELRRAQAP